MLVAPHMSLFSTLTKLGSGVMCRCQYCRWTVSNGHVQCWTWKNRSSYKFKGNPHIWIISVFANLNVSSYSHITVRPYIHTYTYTYTLTCFLSSPQFMHSAHQIRLWREHKHEDTPPWKVPAHGGKTHDRSSFCHLLNGLGFVGWQCLGHMI